MRHAYIPILICAASLGCGFAQDIPTDTYKALVEEWKVPTTLRCLNALRLYTINATADGGFLATAQAEKEAMIELVKGTPANEDLYSVAKDTTDFADTLAKANANNGKTPPGQIDDLIKQAAAVIDKIYAGKKGKQALEAIQQSTDSKVKILQLLDAYPKPDPIDDKYARTLELLRTCYEAAPDRLFKLVGKKISPK